MDDIEIVIKISEKEYDAIKENKYGVFSGHIFETIRNGRPLSKEERWIPVTKRLPEEDGVYLVTVKDELHERLDMMACKYIPSNVVFRFAPFLPNIEHPVVVAWKPLPKLYKESEDEK